MPCVRGPVSFSKCDEVCSVTRSEPEVWSPPVSAVAVCADKGEHGVGVSVSVVGVGVSEKWPFLYRLYSATIPMRRGGGL